MTEKCETDCREERIIAEDTLDKNKVSKLTAWKGLTFTVTILFIVWGIVFGVYGTGLSERKSAIKENRDVAQENKQSIKVIQNDLEYLKRGQAAILHEIRKDR